MSYLKRNGSFLKRIGQTKLTYTSPIVKDGDGNIYTPIEIGTQTWLLENLKTTKYRDGTNIPNLTSNGDWIADTNGAYCWWGNNIANKEPYGALYNFFAVMHVSSIAPYGYRCATKSDWDTLSTFVSGYGGHLKEPGLDHWDDPNVGATNSTGFTGVGNGMRAGHTGGWYFFKTTAHYTLSTSCSNIRNYAAAFYNYMDNYLWVGCATNANHLKTTGGGVRCIKE